MDEHLPYVSKCLNRASSRNYTHKVKPILVFESVKKSLTYVVALNPQPSCYYTAALPAELLNQLGEV